MASPNVTLVNDQTFDAEVLKSDKPVLVDFTASWCGPCKVLSPIVDKIADESQGKFKVVKVDIDEAPTTAATYGIRGVPTVFAFENGAIKGHHVVVTTHETPLRLR